MQTHRAGTLLAYLCVALVGCVIDEAPLGAACNATEATNRDVVLSFYQEGTIGCQPRNAFERYTCPEFVEHKPDIEGGTREATISYLEQLIKEVPDLRWEVIRTASEGDLVFLTCN